ncbi:MAG: hypothetical protein WDZ94_00710 [Patescibacteria group bacterium]
MSSELSEIISSVTGSFLIVSQLVLILGMLLIIVSRKNSKK